MCIVSGISVLLAALLVLNRYILWTVALLPVVLLPLLLITVGVSWFLAGVGVFVRDIGQVLGIISTALLFMSTAFFPLEQVPERLQFFGLLNPLTLPMNQARQVLIWGTMPDWYALGVSLGVSLLVAWFGFWWFQRARVGFADVL
jgi:lipopolysaccharide transport system permease protein